MTKAKIKHAGVFQQWQIYLKFVIVFVLGILLSVVFSVHAENDSINATNVTLDTLFNATFNVTSPELNTSSISGIVANLTNITDVSNISNISNTSDMSNASNSEQDSIDSFMFDVVIESARFVDIKLSQFIPELNITENTTTPKLYLSGYIDSYLLSNISITQMRSAVELDIYTENMVNGTVVTDMDICTYYVNGTSEFVCLVPNASLYTVVATTDYLNETYVRYSIFNQTMIAEELLQNGSISSGELNTSQEPDFGEVSPVVNVTDETNSLLNVTAIFEEAYEGTEIFGTLLVNATTENNTAIMTVHSLEDKTKSNTCQFTLHNSLDFTCPIVDPISGTYEINMTVMVGDTNISIYEVTYLEAPTLRLRIAHDATYNITDRVPIRSFATYDGELIDAQITLDVLSPSGVQFSVTDENPFIEFIANELGYYEVIARTVYRGQNITVDTGLVVGYYGLEKEPVIIDVANETERNGTVEIAPEIIGLPIEDVQVELDTMYEVESLVPVILTLNTSENLTTPMNATITILDPENTTMTFVTALDVTETEIIYLPLEDGNFTADIFIATTQNKTRNITKQFRVVNKTTYGFEKYLVPALETSSRKIAIDELMFNDSDQTFDLTINVSSTSRAKLFGVPSLANISHIQALASNNSQIQTDIFAIDDVNVTHADITLEKTNATNVTRILYCEDWNATTQTCPSWTGARIPFTQNETHINFTVTHFTAYAGGLGNNSVLSIWDISDEDKDNLVSYVDTNINFTANYTDNNTGVAIATALCNITINGSVRNMLYSAGDEIYWYNTTLPSRGAYDYEINCSDVSYDPLNATDNVTVYSIANVTDIVVEDVTLGYSTELLCNVSDGYTSSVLPNYNVSFYSDINGYLGWDETNASGTASLRFTPDYATHTITCNITDNETNYYKASATDELTENLKVHLSSLHTAKVVTYNDSRTYNVTLEIKNAGLGALYNVTIADFVPQTFRTVFSNPYTWNESIPQTSTLGLGTLYYWNITSIAPRSVVTVEYSIIGNSTTLIEPIINSYIVGETYSHD